MIHNFYKWFSDIALSKGRHLKTHVLQRILCMCVIIKDCISRCKRMLLGKGCSILLLCDHKRSAVIQMLQLSRFKNAEAIGCILCIEYECFIPNLNHFLSSSIFLISSIFASSSL